MKRIGLWFAMGTLAVMATNAVGANASGANEATGRLGFVGAVVNEGCSSSTPLLGVRGGMGSCGPSGLTHAVFAEQTGMASDHTGIAMLDYFVDRADGDRKMLVTRQYR
ncbi:hypothetical protein [Dyella terrae]|uniref:hypothetical protein n=1 Tax=Dyella terrae TaxID=522259 RepID=UPI001EFEE2DD|nr:hypothetical protein [Dyella terrae]ULU25856.1 hypothetical protein DYST_02794 [Dyella terrae]